MTRSSVASRKFPQGPLEPVIRAIVPSMRSLSAKSVIRTIAQMNCPCGIKMSASRCPDRSYKGDHIGADLQLHQQLRRRIDDNGGNLAGSGVVQHGQASSSSVRPTPSVHAWASNLRVSSSSCGMTLVWPMIGMKFVSPPQRGTMC